MPQSVAGASGPRPPRPKPPPGSPPPAAGVGAFLSTPLWRVLSASLPFKRWQGGPPLRAAVLSKLSPHCAPGLGYGRAEGQGLSKDGDPNADPAGERRKPGPMVHFQHGLGGGQTSGRARLDSNLLSVKWGDNNSTCFVADEVTKALGSSWRPVGARLCWGAFISMVFLAWEVGKLKLKGTPAEQHLVGQRTQGLEQREWRGRVHLGNGAQANGR